MAASSYGAALARLFAHEGGYTNHPADPGGPTNFGITIADYRKYVKPDATASDVQRMSVGEAKAIYRKRYWDALRCDELPAGVDYAVFDYGVNSGVGRAGKVLRRCLHLSDATSRVADDVIAAAAAADAPHLISAICDERLAFLHSLKTWDDFGRGWERRVAEVKAAALAMTAAPAANASRAPVRSVGTGAAAVSAAAGAHAAGLPLWTVVALALVVALAAAVIAAFYFGTKGMGMWSTIKSSFRHSLTILWARVLAATGMLLALAQGLLADPSIDAAVRQAIQPSYIPYYVIAIGLVTELARRRTAGRT